MLTKEAHLIKKYPFIVKDNRKEICPRCDGTGYDNAASIYICKKCKGKGVVNWIEKIFN